MTKHAVIILGANSAIAKATAAELAKKGYPLFLGGRNEKELKKTASDLSLSHDVKVSCAHFDALQPDANPSLFTQALKEMKEIEGALVAVGYLGEQSKAESINQELNTILSTNFTALCPFLHELSTYLEKRKKGFIATISSVAGDRGRQSNYVYGSAKAGLNTFLQGLRNRLAPSGVQVLTIKPGFVDTPMTSTMNRTPLMVSPEYVGGKIATAIEHRKKDVLYTPWFWRYIMFGIRNIPEKLFKKMKL